MFKQTKSSSTNTKTNTMKRVRFSRAMQDICPEQPPSLCESQVSAMFYSGMELRDIRVQARVLRTNPTILCNRRHHHHTSPTTSNTPTNSSGDHQDCWRGLENRRSELQALRQRHTKTVMEWQKTNQQRQQRGERTTDLMLETTEESRRTIQRALMLGVRDYVEALRIHQEDNNDNCYQEGDGDDDSLSSSSSSCCSSQSSSSSSTKQFSDQTKPRLTRPTREIATARTA